MMIFNNDSLAQLHKREKVLNKEQVEQLLELSDFVRKNANNIAFSLKNIKKSIDKHKE